MIFSFTFEHNILKIIILNLMLFDIALSCRDCLKCKGVVKDMRAMSLKEYDADNCFLKSSIADKWITNAACSTTGRECYIHIKLELYKIDTHNLDDVMIDEAHIIRGCSEEYKTSVKKANFIIKGNSNSWIFKTCNENNCNTDSILELLKGKLYKLVTVCLICVESENGNLPNECSKIKAKKEIPLDSFCFGFCYYITLYKNKRKINSTRGCLNNSKIIDYEYINKRVDRLSQGYTLLFPLGKDLGSLSICKPKVGQLYCNINMHPKTIESDILGNIIDARRQVCLYCLSSKNAFNYECIRGEYSSIFFERAVCDGLCYTLTSVSTGILMRGCIGAVYTPVGSFKVKGIDPNLVSDGCTDINEKKFCALTCNGNEEPLCNNVSSDYILQNMLTKDPRPKKHEQDIIDKVINFEYLNINRIKVKKNQIFKNIIETKSNVIKYSTSTKIENVYILSIAVILAMFLGIAWFLRTTMDNMNKESEDSYNTLVHRVSR